MSARFLYGDPGRYARRLQAALAPGRPGVTDPDFALARDADIVEKVRRDPVIAKALNQRLHYVAACDWRLEAPDAPSRRLLPVFDALLRRIHGFAGARLNLSRAIIEGTRWAGMAGTTGMADLLGDGREQRWWWCIRLIDIDKRRLRLDRIGDSPESGDWAWHLFDPDADTWRRVAHPEHFVRHTVSDDEGSLGYGRGLLESLWFYWRAKTLLFGYMCEGAERFAYPWIVARIAPGGDTAFDASLGGSVPTAEERADALIAALEKMRQASVLVLDHEDQVETVDLSGQGNALILDLVRYVDRCMVELVLGASLPTGSGDERGSLARARIERESTDDLLQFDREALEDTLTRDLIGALWRYNQPAFAALGLAHLSPPALRLGARPDRRPADAVAVVERCARIGLPLQATEVYDALGFTPPSDAPDVLTWSEPDAEATS